MASFNVINTIKNAPSKIIITLGDVWKNSEFVNAAANLTYILSRVEETVDTIYEDNCVYTMNGTLVPDSFYNHILIIIHTQFDIRGKRRAVEIKKSFFGVWKSVFFGFDADVNAFIGDIPIIYETFPFSQQPLLWLENLKLNIVPKNFYNNTELYLKNVNIYDDNDAIILAEKSLISFDVIKKIDIYTETVTSEEILINFPEYMELYLGEFWRSLSTDFPYSSLSYNPILKRISGTNCWSENGEAIGHNIYNRLLIDFSVDNKYRKLTIKLYNDKSYNKFVTLVVSYKFTGRDYIDFNSLEFSNEDWFYTTPIKNLIDTTATFSNKTVWNDIVTKIKPVSSIYFKKINGFIPEQQEVFDFSSYPNDITLKIPADNFFVNIKPYLTSENLRTVKLHKTSANLLDDNKPYAWMEYTGTGWNPNDANRFVIVPYIKYGFELLDLYALSFNNYSSGYVNYIKFLTIYYPNRWSNHNTFLGNLYDDNKTLNHVYVYDTKAINSEFGEPSIQYDEQIIQLKDGYSKYPRTDLTPVYPLGIIPTVPFDTGVNSFPNKLFESIFESQNDILNIKQQELSIQSSTPVLVIKSVNVQNFISSEYDNRNCFTVINHYYNSEKYIKYNLNCYDDVFCSCKYEQRVNSYRNAYAVLPLKLTDRNCIFSSTPPSFSSERYCINGSITQYSDRAGFYLPDALGVVKTCTIQLNFIYPQPSERYCFYHVLNTDTLRLCTLSVLAESNRFAICSRYTNTSIKEFKLHLSTTLYGERICCIGDTVKYPSDRLASCTISTFVDIYCAFSIYEKTTIRSVPLQLSTKTASERYSVTNVVGQNDERYCGFELFYKSDIYCRFNYSELYKSDRYGLYIVHEKGTLFNITVIPARVYTSERFVYYSDYLNKTERKCYANIRSMRILESIDNSDVDVLLMSKNDIDKNVKLTTYGNVDTVISDVNDVLSIMYNESYDKNDINILMPTDTSGTKRIAALTNTGAPIQKTSGEIILNYIGSAKFELNLKRIHELNILVPKSNINSTIIDIEIC